MSIPDGEFDMNWKTAGHTLRKRLRSGQDILVHCRGGLGRADTIAARLLIELGMEPATAIEQIRAVRPGAIETSGQEHYVLGIRSCSA